MGILKKPRWKKFKRQIQPTTEGIRDRLLEIEGATINHAHRFIVRRFNNLRLVQRYTLAWLAFIAILICAGWWQGAYMQRLYSVSGPAEDTTYTEGVFGAADNLNPLFASTPAERSITRLVFGTLLRYDERNQLVGDLAESWRVDATGRIYTVKLRPNLRWHDGAALTSRDVLFTFGTIKNADAKSPLYTSWRTIEVAAVDNLTVTFTLPASYAPFPSSLTVGIVPEHVLGSVPAAQLRNHAFNRSPIVGSGPFVFQDLRAVNNNQSHVIARLRANSTYHMGAPKLVRFNLHAFKDADQLLRAYQTQEVSAISDVPAQRVGQIFRKESDTLVNAPLYDGTFAFLKMGNPYLQDQRVRLALALSANREAIAKRLGNYITPLFGPLLPGQLGFSDAIRQPGYSRAQAEQLLDSAGWVRNAAGKRVKDGQPLTLSLVSVSSGAYPEVVEELLKEWTALGITLQTQLAKPDDFQQAVILPHAYDILVYELAIGSDSDVYAYWHSSQAGQRGLNLSEYRSGKADDGLESARSRLDPALREAKYRAFAQQWVADVPAIALYQPSLLYLHKQNITSFGVQRLVEPADRYNNVIYWSAGKDKLRATP